MITLLNESFVFIDELACFEQMYSNCAHDGVSKKPKKIFYEIAEQFMMDSAFNAKLAAQNDSTSKKRRQRRLRTGENSLVQSSVYVSRVLELFSSQFPPSTIPLGQLNNNAEIRQAVQESPPFPVDYMQADTSSLEIVEIGGESSDKEFSFTLPTFFTNCTNSSLLLTNSVDTSKYIIPGQCNFINGDVNMIRHFVHRDMKYDLIIMDPPWPNKSVKRKNKEFNQISRLPISHLLTDDGLVCVWLSNNETVHNKMRSILEEDWGLRIISTWHWLKICKQNIPVVDFRPNHKVPFESFMIACHNKCATGFESIAQKQDFVVISVPNAHPSRKPPLQLLFNEMDIFKPSKTLELFARYLMVGTTSVGYEAMKFQNQYFFEDV